MSDRQYRTQGVMTIAVIIVNYGTPELAINAVQSVLDRKHHGRNVKIHLVDNASPGEDAKIFEKVHLERDWGAGVRLWLEVENHGFGRGNNRVLDTLATEALPPEYVFLLNPDAVLVNEAIAVLADALDADSRVAAAGARIFKPSSCLLYTSDAADE